MSCASCVEHVQKALPGVDGVISAAVNLATERATVEFVPGAVDRDDLVRAVESAGYKVLASEGDEEER